MSRLFSLHESQLLARSLKISRPMRLVVGTVAGAIAANAAAAMQLTSDTGEVAMIGLLFVSLALGTFAITSDIYSRSSQVVSNLRSLGANGRSISSAIFLAVIGYGAAGSALGAGVGTAVGASLGGQSSLVSSLVVVFAIVLTCSVAAATGVYVGGRRDWPN